MSVIAYLHTALVIRLNELRRGGERDRGDSPVPTAVIIIGLAAAAIAVTVAVSGSVDDWLQELPEPGDAGDGGDGGDTGGGS
ncbi:hypothetical protein [Plantactinospora sonchi]|uniref:Uncharacterized protein n=1 Tax=Plantactinospora sonchi TaxID=1544735 RepID=A0ABU7RP11_9ACTN